MEANDLFRLIDLDDRRAHDAAIDGLWQALMLGGALLERPTHGNLLGDEAPAYDGALVATWEACVALR
ncbi:MAG: hypothetical protein IT338_19985 [Thermomicrobiales bacterium]|nr:hypothetical protein [Thermomicrobiales bacterium]